MSARRAVLLIGSARPRGESTSEALGRYLLQRLEPAGFESQVIHVSHARGPDGLAELTAAVNGAEVFVLATPLYVDALPHLVTAALEHIAAQRAGEAAVLSPAEATATEAAGERMTKPAAEPAPPRFLAIINCGFPESAHTAVAQDICRSFARQARLDCAGTLGLGGGEAIHGHGLEPMGWMTRHVRHALDLAADALANGRRVPEKAVQLMSRPMLPPIGYVLIADTLFWRREARRYGVKSLDARPYPNE